MMFPNHNDIYSSFYSSSPPTINSHGSLHDIFSSSSAAAANNPPLPPCIPLSVEAVVPEKTASDAAWQPLISRARPSRKDRHRKIDTAKGPRDRRMRLSLDVARKFFDLQDLLAFDKASKTVQWLLNKSKAAIKEHVAAVKRKASTFECEEEEIFTVSHNSPVPSKASKRAAAVRNMRSMTTVNPKVARECRDKARARARERTLAKKKKTMMSTQCGGEDEGSEGRKEPLGPQEESSPHEPKSSLEMVAEMDEDCSIISPIHHKEPDDNGSMAIFDYNQAMQSFLDDSWDMCLTENAVDERVLFGELQLQMSSGTLIIPSVFDQM